MNDVLVVAVRGVTIETLRTALGTVDVVAGPMPLGASLVPLARLAAKTNR